MAHQTLRWLAAGTLLLAAPSIVAAESVTRLAPVTPWHVDWSKTSCTLGRGFGEKDDPQILRLEQFGQGQRFQLLIIARSLRGIQQSDKPTLIYGTGEGEAGYADRQDRALVGVGKDRVPTLFVAATDLYGDTPGNSKAIEASVTKLHVKIRTKTVTFETGRLNKAFDALRKCTDDLVKSWGLDPERIKSLTRSPIPLTSPGKWVRSGDYPVGALARGSQALVNFRLLIDSAGKPTECLIQRSYAEEVFNKVTCAKIMARAMFEPALDAQGVPTSSYYKEVVSYVME